MAREGRQTAASRVHTPVQAQVCPKPSGWSSRLLDVAE